jgi:hypothetical protein
VGVSSVIAVIDGRMDGGQPWSPDLSKLNASQIEAWADEAADVYCSVEVVDGIQVRLVHMRCISWRAARVHKNEEGRLHVLRDRQPP